MRLAFVSCSPALEARRCLGPVTQATSVLALGGRCLWPSLAVAWRAKASLEKLFSHVLVKAVMAMRAHGSEGSEGGRPSSRHALHLLQ